MDSLDSRTLIEDAMQELVLEKKMVSIADGENEHMALPWIVELERRLAEVLADSVLNSPHLARLQAMPEDMVATLMHTGPDVPAKRSLLPVSMTSSRRPSSWPCGTASA